MKRNLLTLSLVALSLTTYAQFSRGDKFIHGHVSFHEWTNRINGDDSNSNAVSISPTFGFLLKSNMAMALEVEYSKSHNRYEAGQYLQLNKGTGGRIGVSVRRYFQVVEKLIFSLDGRVSYFRGHSTFEQTNVTTGMLETTKYDQSGISSGIGANFLYFVSPRWVVQTTLAGVNYSNTKYRPTDQSTNNFSFSYGPISLGLSYFFRAQE